MQKSYKDNTAMSDLLLNMLLGIFFMFAISFMLIAPILDAADIKKPKAEYLITMTWPDNNKDDVDIWVEDPLGEVIFWNFKEAGVMHLDRDDLGHVKDVIILSDGREIVNIHNQEIVAIRGFISGEWIINVHMFTKFDLKESLSIRGKPTKVEIKINKLNPRAKIIFMKEVVLDQRKEEKTVTRFTMTANGEILFWSDLPKRLVRATTTSRGIWTIPGSRSPGS